MGEVIVITSGKGGVGKTTTTANIGTGLAQMDKKVILIDTDIGLRNLDVVMGLENRIVYNLVDVIEGKLSFKAGSHQGSEISEPLSDTFSTDEGQDSRQSGTDEKTHRRTER